jgi:Ran GTPase-activating protein (RanGAP) involved in mRNA processing and transport
MGLTAKHINQMTESTTLRHLKELHLHNEDSLGDDGIRTLAAGLPPEIQDLTCSNVGIRADGLEAIARCGQLTNLRRLNLSQNALSPRAAKILAASRSLSVLRSLILKRCRLGDKGVRHLTRAKFWPNLVELDLRENPFSHAGCRYLLDAIVPPDLTALVLTEEHIGAEARNELRKKYGERLVLIHKNE